MLAVFVMTRRTHRRAPDTGFITGFDRRTLLVAFFVPRTILGFRLWLLAGFDYFVAGLGCWFMQRTFGQINHRSSHNRGKLCNLYWRDGQWLRLRALLAFAALLLSLHFSRLTRGQFCVRTRFLVAGSQFLLIHHLRGFAPLGRSLNHGGCDRCGSFSGSGWGHDAALAYFHLYSPRAAGTIRFFNFSGFAADQRNFLGGFFGAMCLAQMFQQLRLVLLGHRVGCFFLGDPGRL